jgi:acetyltransferase-like isoleucine patch superfamily enzyme
MGMSALKRALRARRPALEMSSIKAVSLLPNHAARVAVLRGWGAQVDDTATIYHRLEARAPSRLVVGARSSIGNGAVLDARGGLTIGADVNFSTEVHIWTAQHDWASDDFAYAKAPVVIGDRVWLSTRVTVLPGVTIGEGAVVAAGAVVAKDVAPFTLVGGVPARHIADRPRTLHYELPDRRQKHWWW